MNVEKSKAHASSASISAPGAPSRKNCAARDGRAERAQLQRLDARGGTTVKEDGDVVRKGDERDDALGLLLVQRTDLLDQRLLHALQPAQPRRPRAEGHASRRIHAEDDHWSRWHDR